MKTYLIEMLETKLGKSIQRRFDFRVTDEITEKAERCKRRHCLIAEAISNTFGATHVYVDVTRIMFTFNLVRYDFRPNARIADYIARFDAGGPATTGRFTLTSEDLVNATHGGKDAFALTHGKKAWAILKKAHKLWYQRKRHGGKMAKRRTYVSRLRLNGVCLLPIPA